MERAKIGNEWHVDNRKGEGINTFLAHLKIAFAWKFLKIQLKSISQSIHQQNGRFADNIELKKNVKLRIWTQSI